MPGGLRIVGLVFRIGGIGIFPSPRQRIVVLVRRWSISFLHHLGSGWRVLWVLIPHFFVFATVLPLGPVLQASVVTIFSLLLLKCARKRRVVSCCFTFSKSEFWLVVQSHFIPFLSNFLLLSVFSDRFGMNFAKYCFAPRKDFCVLVFVGGSGLFIASVFSLFGLMPSCDIVCPSHFVSFWENFDFFLLVSNPLSSNLVSTVYTFRVCSSFVPRVTIIMSSKKTCVWCPRVLSFSLENGWYVSWTVKSF